MELIGVLHRGLTSHCKVRLTLYNLLQEVVDRNAELCMEILNLMFLHADNYRMNCSDNVSPIDVEAMVVTNESDGSPSVVEPIGWFLRCVQGLVATADRIVADDETADAQDLDKLKDMLTMLAQKYSQA